MPWSCGKLPRMACCGTSVCGPRYWRPLILRTSGTPTLGQIKHEEIGWRYKSQQIYALSDLNSSHMSSLSRNIRTISMQIVNLSVRIGYEWLRLNRNWISNHRRIVCAHTCCTVNKSVWPYIMLCCEPFHCRPWLHIQSLTGTCCQQKILVWMVLSHSRICLTSSESLHWMNRGGTGLDNCLLTDFD